MRQQFGVDLAEEIVYLGSSETRPPEAHMSTLLIEGGQRSRRPRRVEGNKNAALPLLAACLLTSEECVLTNVPRIGDVEVMARLLLDLGAEVDGIGTRTLRVRAPRSSRTRRTRRWSGGCADRCCCWARCWRDAAGRTSPRPAATFRPPHDLDASDRAEGHGRRESRGPATRSRRPTACRPCRCTSTRPRSRAPRRRCWPRPAEGRTEIRHAATEPHVVELCRFLAKMGAGIEGNGTSKIRIEGVPKRGGARTS